MPKKTSTPAQTDAEKLAAEWLEHSSLARITIEIKGTTIDGETVDMGQATVYQLKRFKTGSCGFNINLKVPDMSPVGMSTGNRFQFSGNVVAAHSKYPGWVKPR